MSMPPNPWSRGWGGGCSSWLCVCWGPSRKNSEKNHILGGEKKTHKKWDFWGICGEGLIWGFGRPFAVETSLKKRVFPPKQRKVGTACNKGRCTHEGLHVSLIPKASLSLRDHKSSTKSAFRREKYREFISFPWGEILMLCRKSRGKVYVWSTSGCCC